MKNEIYEYLDELIPNPKCELNYNKDYELLIAVCLSAQTTDRRVNQVTQVLFNKYKTLNELKNAQISDIENIIKPLGTYKRKAITRFNCKRTKDGILRFLGKLVRALSYACTRV